MSLVPVGIALGSNLGDRAAELDAGVAFLRSLAVDGKVRESGRIETAPVDCPPGSPPFLNAVAEIRVDTEALPPRELLGMLQAFELSRGRAPIRAVNSPRPLDLDIIYYGDLVVDEPDLVIPHPRAHLRGFVQEPLAQLRPGFVLPKHTGWISARSKKKARIAAKRAMVILGGLFLLWYGIFGGEVFGPALDAAVVKSKISTFLKACPADEVRFAKYEGYGGRYVYLILNFTDRQPVAGVWDNHLGPWELFWMRGFPPVSPTIWGASGDQGHPYTSAEMADIKSTLAALPEPKSLTRDSYGERLHLAFWQEERLRICDYTKSEFQSNCYKLRGLMGVDLYY